jgi:hypothetical protein
MHLVGRQLREAFAHLAAAAAVVAARAARMRAHDDAVRHAPRPPFLLAAGTEERTTGVPIAAAMCIGAESTPKSRARADSAPISRS